MDATAPDFETDSDGVCNYCRELDRKMQSWAVAPPAEQRFRDAVDRIRSAGKGRRYDCVVGLSGGLDSSYVLHVAHTEGLRVLAVHLDNGWNSELAVHNIEKLVKGYDIDLYTYVLDWPQFRDLQRSLFAAHVVDLELATDNAIEACIVSIARKYRIPYVVSGSNDANEGMRMPPGWNHPKSDLKNIRAIHRRFGERRRLPRVPLIGPIGYGVARYVSGQKRARLLNHVPFHKPDAEQTLQAAVGWRPYGFKHYESIFTRFYQGFILPTKFGIDKRKLHLSTLVVNGQMTREEAIEALDRPAYPDEGLLRKDRGFVTKKLGFSEVWFEDYLAHPPVPHTDYPSSAGLVRRLIAWERRTRDILSG